MAFEYVTQGLDSIDGKLNNTNSKIDQVISGTSNCHSDLNQILAKLSRLDDLYSAMVSNNNYLLQLVQNMQNIAQEVDGLKQRTQYIDDSLTNIKNYTSRVQMQPSEGAPWQIRTDVSIDGDITVDMSSTNALITATNTGLDAIKEINKETLEELDAVKQVGVLEVGAINSILQEMQDECEWLYKDNKNQSVFKDGNGDSVFKETITAGYSLSSPSYARRVDNSVFKWVPADTSGSKPSVFQTQPQSKWDPDTSSRQDTFLCEMFYNRGVVERTRLMDAMVWNGNTINPASRGAGLAQFLKNLNDKPNEQGFIRDRLEEMTIIRGNDDEGYTATVRTDVGDAVITDSSDKPTLHTDASISGDITIDTDLTPVTKRLDEGVAIHINSEKDESRSKIIPRGITKRLK